MIIGNLFQQLYTMTDSVIVGQAVGESALAAVGASYALTNVFISIAIGGGVGASVLTSQAFGRRDYHRMKRFISTALFTFLAVSLLLGGFGLAFSGQIMAWLRTPASILDDAAVYLNIYFLLPSLSLCLNYVFLAWACPFCLCTMCSQPCLTRWGVPKCRCTC